MKMGLIHESLGRYTYYHSHPSNRAIHCITEPFHLGSLIVFLHVSWKVLYPLIFAYSFCDYSWMCFLSSPGVLLYILLTSYYMKVEPLAGIIASTEIACACILLNFLLSYPHLFTLLAFYFTWLSVAFCRLVIGNKVYEKKSLKASCLPTSPVDVTVYPSLSSSNQNGQVSGLSGKDLFILMWEAFASGAIYWSLMALFYAFDYKPQLRQSILRHYMYLKKQRPLEKGQQYIGLQL